MSEPFLSEIKIMSFGFAPKGWAQCNGQLLPINQNQPLFSLLGTTYGGDGRTTFALPPSTISATGGSQAHDNMQPYLVLNFCIALVGVYPSQN